MVSSGRSGALWSPVDIGAAPVTVSSTLNWEAITLHSMSAKITQVLNVFKSYKGQFPGYELVPAIVNKIDIYKFINPTCGKSNVDYIQRYLKRPVDLSLIITPCCIRMPYRTTMEM